MLRQIYSDPEYLILMFLFREVSSVAKVAVGSSKDVGSGAAENCSKAVASVQRRHVRTAASQRQRGGCTGTDTKPAYRDVRSVVRHALSPP